MIVNPDNDPKLTFWSVPPIRQWLRTVAITVKLRDARFLIAQVYGTLYLLYGLKIPLIWFIVAHSIVGTSPLAIDFLVSGIPFLLPAAIVCMLISSIAGGGAAWYIMGRAMRTRRRSRLHWAIWGALGAGAPMLSLVAIAPSQRLPAVGAILILMLLFGAGLGAVFHWVVERDQAPQAQVSSTGICSSVGRQ